MYGKNRTRALSPDFAYTLYAFKGARAKLQDFLRTRLGRRAPFFLLQSKLCGQPQSREWDMDASS
jgi:hypothetical protein